MALAQIGPLTELVEMAAAAVAAGMLLGGFLAGLAGLVRSWPRRDFDRIVVQAGYLGGVVSTCIIAADIMFHHAL